MSTFYIIFLPGLIIFLNVNKIFILFIGLGIVAVIGYFLWNRSTPNSKNVEPTIQVHAPALTKTPARVNYSAGFAIFTNGTFRVFTASMYHNLSPDVFIESSNPNIVRVKKAGLTWNDFFKTLPFKLTKDCLTTGTKETFCTNNAGTLRFYLNGKIDPKALDREITVDDKFLATYGNENENQIQKQLQQIPTIK